VRTNGIGEDGMRGGVKEWFCTDGYFDTDADLAEHLAGLVEDGKEPISFWRFDCIFGLRWTDVAGLEQLPDGSLSPHPVAMARRFTVAIAGAVHGSTTAAKFLELWPDGFSSVHQYAVRKDMPDASVADSYYFQSATDPLRRTLWDMGSKLWPDLYVDPFDLETTR
jgi:hypothetical protein